MDTREPGLTTKDFAEVFLELLYFRADGPQRPCEATPDRGYFKVA